MLGSLGSVPQKEVWDEANQVYLYTPGDQSVLILLYGVATVLLTALMVWAWRGALKSAFQAECLDKAGAHVNTFAEDLKSLLHENLHRLLMTPPMIFILALTILPLIFMICMAFTNYSRIDNHLMLFDWVGLDNFKTLFDADSVLGSTFWSVLGWTLVWAFFATFSNYILGMILAIVINRKDTRAKDLKSLLHENLHRLLMTPPMIFILALTILPLIFMICMAFTNYSRIDNHLMLFDWVGLDNFKTLFDADSVLGSTFWSVLGWTLVWAFFATFSNYILGMILAIVINRKDTRAKGFWRFCFVLSCAIPMFVSLLIMRTMLQPNGAVNVLLRNLGWIAQDASLPFFTDPTWARVTVIIVNIWVGVPYTLLQLTGVLQNIPGELYEAAKVDGANAVQIFFKITLPYMLYVTTPYLIVTFTGNVNNFNVIYLLSGGDPVTDLASTAGKTDLLVTWLYKLTIDKQYYNIGAVIGILTFIILAVGALLTYRNSKSYKEGGI